MDTFRGKLVNEVELKPGQKMTMLWQNESTRPYQVGIYVETLPDGSISIRSYLRDIPDESQEPKGEIVSFPPPGACDVESDA